MVGVILVVIGFWWWLVFGIGLDGFVEFFGVLGDGFILVSIVVL